MDRRIRFKRHPKSYYGIFSFFFRSKLYVLFVIYIVGVTFAALMLSAIIEIEYSGPLGATPDCISWIHKFYFSATTFISPGFTEFLPENDFTRIASLAAGATGVAYNALFLSILIARALQPHEPFVVVPFLLYHPRNKTLTARLYSTLPTGAYNLKIRCYRFLIFEDETINSQMGRSIEINTNPAERSVLLPNYGLLIRVKLEDTSNPHQATPKKIHKRKKCPIEWILPDDEKYSEGHLYLTIEAETAYGKMFQSQYYYLSNEYIKCGTHALLNQEKTLTLSNWYSWRAYRWDLWGKYNQLPSDMLSSKTEDPILDTYYDSDKH